MKKKLVFIGLYLSFLSGVRAQTWNEWFAQKKTQIKYLTQQVAALQVYEGYLSKGYNIAKNGLHLIGDAKNGELHLHEAFFSSLSQINPAIRHFTPIADMIAMQYNTLAMYRRCVTGARQNHLLSANERQYISSVFAALLNGRANDVSDLVSLTKKGQLQLSDDERLQRIDAIYTNIKDKNAFAQSFSSEVAVLMLNRQKEEKEIFSIKKLFNGK